MILQVADGGRMSMSWRELPECSRTEGIIPTAAIIKKPEIGHSPAPNITHHEKPAPDA